ncbi:hypothetical protein JCM15786_16310 [Nautilia lithotrophica]
MDYFHLNFIPRNILDDFTKVVTSFTSVIATISIAFFIAKRIKISEIIAIFLSIILFLSITIYENPEFPLILPYGFTIATIFAPIFGTYFLKLFYPKLSLHINISDGNYHIYRFFNYIFVFFAAYFATMTIYISIDAIMDIVIDKFNPLSLDLPNIIILAIRDILVQLFWFVGIHGEHMVSALFGKEILFKQMLPNLTYGEFHRIFINIGGAGIGLSLLIALLLYAKNETVKTIAKISSPFVIFNINDIIIFLIIVFNRFLFIPFVFLPILNLILAYIFINAVPLHFTTYNVIWSTPVFVDGYLKTNSLVVPLFQVVLITIDTLVYSYFIKKYFEIQSLERKKHILQNNLEITDELRAKKDIKAFLANQELIEANTKLNELINDLNQDNLMIYYQPKIDIKNNKAQKFEALIRYNDNGQIRGPFFLDIIEKSGLAPIIDIWVCKQIKKDLLQWQKEHFFPQISINLHPDTLKSTDAINKIIGMFKEENIIFEIIERSFIDERAKENINRLVENNYLISIDDFGVGYSSLETLIKHKFDELKLDKTLIDEIETKKGFLVCQNTVHLCKDLNIKVVAEGVENKFQLNSLKFMDVDYIQGYYFSPALPFEKVKKFSEEFNLNDF